MELTTKIFDQDGKEAGQASLAPHIFATKPKEQLLFDTVLMQLASRRQGTAKTKGRAEVRGGGKKPYKQKGTGQARRGTERSPIMVGGGNVFGPRPRSYEYRLPQKVRAT